MTGRRFTLINGRTMKQGRGIHHGKYSTFYEDEISAVEMNKTDLETLGATEGQKVTIKSDYGSVTIPCRETESVPQGIVFIPYGFIVNRLVGADTGGTGMPSFKGIEVEICL